jgi:deoxyinosine 3'endonuclease (endonuclease V)
VETGELSDVSLVAGVDVSFPADASDPACALLVVCRVADASAEVVYEDEEWDVLVNEYIPGLLGAREVPLVSRLLERLPEAFRSPLRRRDETMN